MNKFIQAVTNLDLPQVRQMLESQPKWRSWSQPDGKNALHFLCGVDVGAGPTGGAETRKASGAPDNKANGRKGIQTNRAADTSLKILKLLLKHGLDINSIHSIPNKNCAFPATPLWYAYTRGRNEKIYTWLLRNGADPNNCMFAITWYDDVEAAGLFKKYGALQNSPPSKGGVAEASEAGVGTDQRLPADPNKVQSNQTLPPDKQKLLSDCLLAAIFWKKLNMAKWLLENGADPNATDPQGRTALLYIVKKKFDVEYIKLLLCYGADPDCPYKTGQTPRELASSYRDKSILRLIEASENNSRPGTASSAAI